MYKLQQKDYLEYHNMNFNSKNKHIEYWKYKLFYLIHHMVPYYLMGLCKQLYLQFIKIYIIHCYYHISYRMKNWYLLRQHMKYLKQLLSKLFHSINRLAIYYLNIIFLSYSLNNLHKLYHIPCIYCNMNWNHIFHFEYNFNNILCW